MMPPLPKTVTSTTRYELWRFFDDAAPGKTGRWVVWHQGRVPTRLKQLRKNYIKRGVPERHLRMIVVSEERRIIP
jgi:hypothetical protein